MPKSHHDVQATYLLRWALDWPPAPCGAFFLLILATRAKIDWMSFLGLRSRTSCSYLAILSGISAIALVIFAARSGRFRSRRWPRCGRRKYIFFGLSSSQLASHPRPLTGSKEPYNPKEINYAIISDALTPCSSAIFLMVAAFLFGTRGP